MRHHRQDELRTTYVRHPPRRHRTVLQARIRKNGQTVLNSFQDRLSRRPEHIRFQLPIDQQKSHDFSLPSGSRGKCFAH